MKDLFLSIVNIFRYTGKFFTVLRNLLFNLLLLVILVTVIFSLIPGERQFIPPNTVLRLDISGDIVEERRTVSLLEKMFSDSADPENPEPETALQDILDVIAAAAEDDRIAVLLLNLKHLDNAGLNQLQAIGKALDEFRKTGKQVISAEDYYTQAQYYLAAHADKVIVNPMGGVDLHGFGVYRLYFRETLEKLSVNYNIFKVGAYKSALEPFTRDNMSSEDREQNQKWLSALWQVYTDDISAQRKMPRQILDNYTNNIDAALAEAQGNAAQLARKTGLVDEVWTRPQVISYLSGLTKTTEENMHTVSSLDYYGSVKPSFGRTDSGNDKIGLIIAEGTMLPGKQPPGFIGGDSLARLLREANEDDQIKALVLRINSGGGSAFAAEVIRQQLLEVKKKGKPVVISMGTLAASGGYWIAADADQIWAADTTLTGSIGIFGAIPTFEKTLAELGVYSDGTGTTPLSSGLDLTQPLPEQLKGAIQQAIAYNYQQFLDIVSSGRKIDKTRVEELAEGKVFDGKTAQALGLVDRLGTLEEAIDAAAGLAGLQEYETEYIRPPESWRNQFLQFFAAAPSTEAGSAAGPALLVRLKKLLESRLGDYLLLDDPRGIYALCPITLKL